MVFPPTILDRVRQGVQAKVAAAGGVAAYLFGQAEEARERADLTACRINLSFLYRSAMIYRIIRIYMSVRVVGDCWRS